MKNEGFTLVELLAVILILSFIAIIAVPIIINIIAEAKYSSTKLSVEYYLDAIEKSLLNNEVIGGKSNDGIYTIKDNGKLISNIDNEIYISYDGNGLEEGIVQIENGKVIRLSKCKINGYYAKIEDDQVNLYKTIKESTLINDTAFNAKVKQLVGIENGGWNIGDTIVKEITFLPDGMLPKGYTKEELMSLKSTPVSSDGSINAYYDEKNGVIYVYSDNYIYAGNMHSTFHNFNALKRINFNGFDTSRTISFANVFMGCSSLEELDLSNLDISNSNDIQGMFGGCNSLTSLDLSNFDTKEATNMQGMFNGCTNLKEIKGLDNFDTSNIKFMSSMFNGCTSLKEIKFGKNFDTSQVTTMVAMFNNCNNLEKLDLSSFNTSNVTDMSTMFQSCLKLKNIIFGKDFNTGKVTNMFKMFRNCSSLTNLDLSNFKETGLLDNTGQMFGGCTNLTTLDLTNFDTKSVTNMVDMFGGCTNLIVVKVTKDKWTFTEAQVGLKSGILEYVDEAN